MAGQKLVCGLQHDGLHVGPENKNLLEKKVSEKSVKPYKHNGFSPFFSRCHFVIINAAEKWQWQSENWPVGCNVMDHALAQKIAV